MDEELIPEVSFVEDMQGCGRLQKKVVGGQVYLKISIISSSFKF